MREVLRFDAVTRTFGATTALDELSVAVESGTVVGLVGRNGAGKTTALRLAIGTLHPDRGKISTLGLDPTARGREVRERVSLLSEESHLYPWMRVQELLDLAGRIHPRWDRAYADRLRDRLTIDGSAAIRNLSRGSKAKVAVLIAVACRPELLLLDDPTAGLDPLVRREVLQEILQATADEGGSVIYASHLIHDVERVADRVVFLDEGALRLDERLDDLKRDVRRVSAVFDRGVPEDLVLPGQLEAEANGRVFVAVARGERAALEAHARRAGARSVEIDALSLEEILVSCLKESCRV